MKPREEWGPADHLAEAVFWGVSLAVVAVIIWAAVAIASAEIVDIPHTVTGGGGIGLPTGYIQATGVNPNGIMDVIKVDWEGHVICSDNTPKNVNPR